jgi:uncharacterized OsmC-like protein
MKSTSIHIRNRQFVCTNNREAAIILDLQNAKGGNNQGPTPYELIGMALSGCVAITYETIARNSKVSFSALRVEIETFTPEGEKILTSVDVVAHIKSDTNKDRLQRIYEKAAANCHVGLLLRKAGIQITEKLVIE